MRIRITSSDSPPRRRPLVVAVERRRRAAQQIDTNPPLPNVLLLVDNSGLDGADDRRQHARDRPSTALRRRRAAPTRATASTTDRATAPTCNWTGAAPPTAEPVGHASSRRSRARCRTASTASRCRARRAPRHVRRPSTRSAAIAPYDINYYLPFHRMVAHDPTVRSDDAAACARAWWLRARSTARSPARASARRGRRSRRRTRDGLHRQLRQRSGSTAASSRASTASSSRRCRARFAQNTDGAITTMTATSCASG